MKEAINEELNEQIKTLNDLLGKCYDADAGYRDAAAHVDSAALKSLFLDLARQRREFCNQLEQGIGELGGKANTGSSLAGGVHRTWMNLKSAIAGNDEKAMLEECLRGEKVAYSHYDKVLESVKLPNDIRMLLNQQFQKIEEAIERLEALK